MQDTPSMTDAIEGRWLRIARRLRLLVTSIASVMNYIAGWAFIVCAIFITADVLLRNFAGVSSSATTEITGYILAFGIAWGLAHTLAMRAHIRVDVLVNKLPLRWRQYLHTIALVILTALACFFAWCAWSVVQESILFNAKDTSALSIPLVIPQSLWAFGVSMLAVMAVTLLLEVLCRLMAGDAAGIDELLGPRGYKEETEEALDAVGLTNASPVPESRL